MFYTEYRPKNFSDLIGVDEVVKSLTRALASNNVAHAFFFTGSRGTGKTSTARLLAKALNCQNPVITEHNEHYPHIHFEPCGQCENCKSIQNGNHLDLIEIDAASNRGIDDIRTLREGVNLSPTMGVKKVYIIDEVHMLTNEASNALLKTLEEPPAHAFFILCTTNPEKVIDTIKSRCIQVTFKKPSIASLKQKLKKIVDDKGLNFTDEDLMKIAKMAKGAFRDAETYLEQLVSGESSLSNYYGQGYDFYSFTNSIVNKNVQSAILQVNSFFNNQSSIEIWLEKYVDYLRALLFVSIGLVTENTEIGENDIKLAKSMGPVQIKNLLKRFNDVPLAFKSAVYPTLPIEIAIVELTSVSNETIAETKVETDTPNNQNGGDKPVDNVSTLPAKNVGEIKKEDVKSALPVDIIKTENIEILTEATISKEEKSQNQTELKQVNFKYKDLVLALKEDNHSVYLLLSSCNLLSFDGKYLVLSANYSFHKERILSNKIRNIIEDVATKLIGSQVVVNCEIDKSNKDAKRLTDKNVIVPAKGKIEDVFQNVFGDELEVVAE